MRILLLLAAFVFSGFGFSAPPAPALPGFNGSTIDAVNRSEHVISIRNAIQGGRCTASAVGPHWLLTAGHCYVVSSKITVDGDVRNILGFVGDDNDHLLVRVDGPVFTSFLPIVQRAPQSEEQVVVIGNPGRSRNVMRFGIFTKSESYQGEDKQSHEAYWFQMFGAPGDSGSGMVDSRGNIIGVMTGGIGGDALTMSFALNFQAADLAKLALA